MGTASIRTHESLFSAPNFDQNKQTFFNGRRRDTNNKPDCRTSMTSRRIGQKHFLLAHPGATRQKGPAVVLPVRARDNAL